MKCPIIGDNKYSGINKSIPEYNNEDNNNIPSFLQQQIKKKYPLYLHCLRLNIPQINKPNIEVYSKPPDYFHLFLKNNLKDINFKTIL